MPSWEELIAEASNGGEELLPGDGADDVTLVSKAQFRLDEELQASGYSKEDAARDSELAYYEAHQKKLNCDLDVVDDVDDEEEDDNSDDEDHVNENDKKDLTNNEKEAGATPEADGDDQAPELLDMDEFHIDSTKTGNDGASVAGGVSIGGMSRMSQISHVEAEKRARERVRQHLENRKRSSGKKGAFKTRNSNKSYSKGKRVMNDDF